MIHDNGLWLKHNHDLARLAARRGIPRLVSTWGMLEPWALKHKRIRKQEALISYQRRDLEGAWTLHATSEREPSFLLLAIAFVVYILSRKGKCTTTRPDTLW